MRGIIRDTVAEMVDRKILILYGIVTGLGALMVLGVSSMDIQFQSQGMGMSEMGQILGNPLLRALDTFCYMLVFLTVMATAGLIPSMFIKGRAEFFLSKPISRTSLLLNRLLAIWAAYSGLITACMITLVLVGAATIEFVGFGFVYVILINLVILIIWLSVTMLAGVISGSSAMSIMSAFLVWILQKILAYHEWFAELTSSKIVSGIVDTLYYIVPKMGEISDMAINLALDRPVEWMPLYSSLLTSALLVTLALYLFSRKDY